MYAVLTRLYDDLKAKGAAGRGAEFEGQRPQPAPFSLPVPTPGLARR